LEKKKITVKHFINKSLPLTDIYASKADEECIGPIYPLYVQVTYNRKNTQFKSSLDMGLQNFEYIEDTMRALMEEEKKMIIRIIEYELKKLKSGFTLKSLRKKYKHYTTPILNILERYVHSHFINIVKKSKTKYADLLTYEFQFNVTFSLILDAARELIPNFNNYMDSEIELDFKVLEMYYQIFGTETEPFMNSLFMSPVFIDWSEGYFINRFKNSISIKYPELELNELIIASNRIISTHELNIN
jgi:hypothetical protein